MPTCWIMAGPNGAGKTTFALEYLPQIASGVRFINADLIAAGLSALAPERELMAAGRIFLGEIDHCVAVRQDFALETTLAGRSYLRLVEQLRAADWRVVLIYLALPSVEIMNDGATPAIVFEQRGNDREVLNDDGYQLLLEEAAR